MTTKLIIAAVAMTCSLAVVAKAQTPIHINKWPDDVPCSALQKSLDGSWTQVVPIVVGTNMMTGNTFKNTAETRLWDQKCGAAPKP